MAQNLVPNPGFELMNNCNLGLFDQTIHGFISNWYTYSWANSSVDILHTCLPFPQLRPPNTVRGYSFCHSGDGMAGIAYSKKTDYREIVSVTLLDTLIKDSAYCVNFWVKNSKITNVYYWVEQIGLLFTNDTISNSVIRNNNPHVRSHVLLDKNEWLEISGYYIANGDEKFINIGFFGNQIDEYSNKPFEPGFAAFYFIDDVSVTLCNKDSLLSVVCELPNVLTPNHDDYNDLYVLKLNNIKKLDVQIFNRWGNMVRVYDGTKETWDGTDQNGMALTDGVYYVKAIGESTFGDIISKYQFVHLIR